MKRIKDLLNRKPKKVNNKSMNTIAEDTDDAMGWFNYQEKPFVSYKENENN